MSPFPVTSARRGEPQALSSDLAHTHLTGVMRLLPRFASELPGDREGSDTAGAGCVLVMGSAGGDSKTEGGVGTPVRGCGAGVEDQGSQIGECGPDQYWFEF